MTTMSGTPNSQSSPLYASETPSTASPGSRSVKRQKVTRSCDSCKARKRKCSGDIPCFVCRSTGATCTYKASYTRGKLVHPTPAYSGTDTGNTARRAVPFTPTEAAASPLTTLNQGDSKNPGPSRAASPEGGSTFAGQYLGPTSPYTFLRRAWKRFEEDGSKLHHIQAASEEPSSAGSIFQFGDRPSPYDVSHTIEIFRLPERELTSAWLAQYFNLAMPTYRFLHYDTVARWLEEYHQLQESGIAPALLSLSRQAVVLVVLATSRLLNVQQKEVLNPNEVSWRESEVLYRVAQRKLDSETGKAKLACVQARLVSCLYLLSTSRPNQAWYKFGTTIQLIMSLGLHRANSGCSQDPVIRECRKRIFWAASTLDTYLSVILGKPPLIHLDDVDQKLPEAIDDQDLTIGLTAARQGEDSVIRASILHAQITCIVKQAAREQYSVSRKTSQQKLGSAQRFNAEVKSWHASLPVVLSGAIHPSSLIPIFRRQITVLQLAHAHARMLINRPSLILETGQLEFKLVQVQECITAAKDALDTVLASSFSKETFQAFWYTQFVSFNALTIAYIYLIQRQHGRLVAINTDFSEDELLLLAETVQKHLTEATQMNAPSLRYNIVLEELQQEVHRAIVKANQRPANTDAIVKPKVNGFPTPPEQLHANVFNDVVYNDSMMEAFASAVNNQSTD
ncbi:fungal specific transcription factor domain-containing protein [Zymoseptoria brevis]|uniref:Fungal specific transcription factor domain-containing protein n=1 Tax=Zymoseptoria brevis TaxID=1047168 RepID=A0A0F4G9R8_9PEZI|nr:fungal specific transcription factor domain-containing protein [Zymoseptoria brevis]